MEGGRDGRTEGRTHLAVLLHRAARHLGRVLDEEVVQHVHLPAFLAADGAADGAHWKAAERMCGE